jgi:integrase
MPATAAAEPTWPELVDRFTTHLDDEERSPHTVRNYRDDLAAFRAWYRTRYGEEPQLATLTKRDVVDWKGSIEATGGRKAKDDDGKRTVARKAEVPTVNRKLCAIRSFFRWAQGEDLGVRFEAPKPQRKQGKPDPRWLSRAEERALAAAVEAANSARDVAILYLGLHGGLRVAEMQALEWPDITISERKGELRVRKGKGRKERTVKLSKTLRHALLDLGGGRRSGPILTGQRGALSIRGLQDIAERYGRAARVGKVVGLKDFSIHSLRHTCARRMIEARIPLPDVAGHLGHADVKTTMGYVGSKDEDLARAAEALDD